MPISTTTWPVSFTALSVSQQPTFRRDSGAPDAGRDAFTPSGAMPTLGAAQTLPGLGQGDRGDGAKGQSEPGDASQKAGGSSGKGEKSGGKVPGGKQELSKDDQERVAWLKNRDQEVHTHEQAHVAAGGPYVRGGISYTYETGPDGKQYAIGGEVSIDTTPIADDPEATIRKAQTVRRAALAPANPSNQDRRAAAAAAQMEAQAQQELLKQDPSGKSAGAGSGGKQKAPASGEKSAEPSDGKSGTVGRASSKSDGGLPGVPERGTPVARLDYGRRPKTGQMVDVYG